MYPRGLCTIDTVIQLKRSVQTNILFPRFQSLQKILNKYNVIIELPNCSKSCCTSLRLQAELAGISEDQPKTSTFPFNQLPPQFHSTRTTSNAISPQSGSQDPLLKTQNIWTSAPTPIYTNNQHDTRNCALLTPITTIMHIATNSPRLRSPFSILLSPILTKQQWQ